MRISPLAEATIVDASSFGKGFPDIVVGLWGANYLVELKDSNKPPSARRLTNSQVSLHANWQGQIAVCTTSTDVVATILRHIRKK